MATFRKATITADDFKNAPGYLSNTDCPLARALKHAGMQKVWVRGGDYEYINPVTKKRFTVFHTSKLQEVLGRYMHRTQKKSFTFLIPVA